MLDLQPDRTVSPSGPRPPARPGDSEKITINLGPIDLGHLDLLVAEGVYANRSISSARRSATRSSATPR